MPIVRSADLRGLRPPVIRDGLVATWKVRVCAGEDVGDPRCRRAVAHAAPDTGARTGPGGFVELSFPEAGDYPFVSHVMVDAERSAHGIIEVGDR